MLLACKTIVNKIEINPNSTYPPSEPSVACSSKYEHCFCYSTKKSSKKSQSLIRWLKDLSILDLGKQNQKRMNKTCVIQLSWLWSSDKLVYTRGCDSLTKSAKHSEILFTSLNFGRSSYMWVFSFTSLKSVHSYKLLFSSLHSSCIINL